MGNHRARGHCWQRRDSIDTTTVANVQTPDGVSSTLLRSPAPTRYATEDMKLQKHKSVTSLKGKVRRARNME